MNLLPQLTFLLLLRIKGVFVNGLDSEIGYKMVVAQLGEPLSLMCRYNCTAWTRASWHLKKTGAPVCTSCFQETKKKDRNGSLCTERLSLRYVSLNQTHYNYVCHSEEHDDPSRTQKMVRQVSVWVQAAPSAPVVTVTPQGDVWAGRPVGLMCTTGGFHPRNVTVAWAFNGSPVMGTDELTLGTTTNGTFSARSKISVLPTSSHHRGIFTCEIHHTSLSHPLRANITLDVKYLSLHVSYRDGTESTAEALPPPLTIRTRVGAFLELSCLVDSNPLTEGQWVRGSVDPSRQAMRTATTLTLDKVKVEDAGNYSCEASTRYETKQSLVTIEVNPAEFSWFMVLAATMVTVATVLCAAAVYFSLSSRRRRNAHLAFTTCDRGCMKHIFHSSIDTGKANGESRVETPPATGDNAVKWEPVAVTFTPADSQSDHEVPYADIMISVRGASTPELTHIPDPTPREHRQRWKEEWGSSGLLQVSHSADRLHVHQRDVARKLSTSSEYAVIQYRSEPLG
ncbi:sialic acid-binding Ig-like lectin 8 isoform X1 [Anguilla rostrata]|uniref:sialic acid-binding Ig-like lectin 8 isoform X1 n=1 Tax=Anguilla rostrata TaxID=7938 RepID=UPI0030CCC004